jgi:hypothetical protein
MRARWVVLLVVASNLLTLAIVFGTHWYVEEHSFDAAKWHARLPGDCNDDHREKMVDDLAENYLEVGMDRSDVLFLLGLPDTNQETPDGSRVLNGWDTGRSASECDYFRVNFARDGRIVVGWSGGPTEGQG